jgi:hypothetical protein
MIEVASKLFSKKILAANLSYNNGGVVNITLYENKQSLQKPLNTMLMESIVDDVFVPSLPQVM